jgi:hypothetical protein
VPGARWIESPVTVTENSVKPKAERPVGICVAGSVPLNNRVPPLPLDTPERISYDADVTVVLIRLFENNDVTSHPEESVTLKSLYT